MKFIKTLDNEILNIAFIRSVYILINEDGFPDVIAYSDDPLTGVCDDNGEYLLGAFKNMADAENFLDNLLKKLNGDD